MNRRSFTKTGLTSLLGASIVGKTAASFAAEKSDDAKPYKLKFAPNVYKWSDLAPVSTKDMDAVQKIQYYYDHGFRALEDNDMMKYPVEKQEAMAAKLKELKMDFGVFTTYSGSKDFYMNANRSDLKSKPDKPAALDRTRQMIANACVVAKRVGAKWGTIVPAANDPSLERGYQIANIIEHMRVAVEVSKGFNFTLVLEPLSFTEHPGLFLQKTSDAYAICKGVNSPYCKILFDIFHQQNTEGGLIRNIDYAWDEIAYFHMADVPGRAEPTSGEINFKNVIKHIHDKGYRGLYGMEHKLKDKTLEGEKKLFKIYRDLDVD